MIKLIVSDVDGTLIQSGRRSISHKMFELIEECAASNIVFAVASGRQYPNLKRLFAPVWENIYFIAENGNITFYKDEIIHKVAFPKLMAQELIVYLEEASDCVPLISTPYYSFIHSEPEWFVREMLLGMGITVTLIDDFRYLIHEDILTISAYAEPEAIDLLTKQFKKDWGYHLLVTPAGGRWIDFALSGKGAAVRRLADDLHISADEIMVFGDHYNDEQMFSAATHSYCMSSADDYLKQKANYVADNVETIVEAFLNTGEIPQTANRPLQK